MLIKCLYICGIMVSEVTTMAKCIKCGKSFFGRIKIKLADAEICSKCYDELGFDHKTGLYIGSTYKWSDIKDGYDVMRDRENAKRFAKNAAEVGLIPKHYKQLNENIYILKY